MNVSSSGATMPGDQEWARSLVGRSWEIFWDDRWDDGEEERSSTADSAVMEAVVDPSQRGADASAQHSEHNVERLTGDAGDVTMVEDGEEIDSGSESEGDTVDWYESKVLSAEKCDDKGCWFKVQFEGDDTIYDMPLVPSIVRPSARAWIKRTLAILEKPTHHGSTYENGIASWEKSLPHHTALLSDSAHLEDMRIAVHSGVSAGGESPLVAQVEPAQSNGISDFKTARPRVGELEDIRHLLFLVKVQIFLRSRLAPMAEDQGTAKIRIPTRIHVDYLLKCLHELEKACSWYLECWQLLGRVFNPGVANGSERSLIDPEFLSRDCLEYGSEILHNLTTLDLSEERAKKNKRGSDSQTGTRKTKRRRTDQGNGPAIFDHGRSESDDETSFGRISSESLQSFASHSKEKDDRWFVKIMASMLLNVCCSVYEPLKDWQVSIIRMLGDGRNQEDEKELDSESCEEEKENEDVMHTSIVGSHHQRNNDDERMYTYDEVASFLTLVSEDRLLKQFDLSTWTRRIDEKLERISVFEANGSSLLARVLEHSARASKTGDEVLTGLKALRDISSSEGSLMKNVDPLARSSSSRLNRRVINDAITVRSWVLDLLHTEQTRERIAFVQNTISQASKLPHIPMEQPSSHVILSNPNEGTSSTMGQLMARTQVLSSMLFSHIETFAKYDHKINIRTSSFGRTEQLHDSFSVLHALDQLGGTPVISVAEEKLAVRFDLLQWIQKAKFCLISENGNPSYQDVIDLSDFLNKVRHGICPHRVRLVDGLAKNEMVDREVCEFATADIVAFCRDFAVQIDQLHSLSTEWIGRADCILSALSAHGNAAVVESSVKTGKVPAMIDLKRIEDLLDDGKGLGIAMPKFYMKALSDAVDDAKKWSISIEKTLLSASDALGCLSLLQERREDRPKGILMEPARHVVDSWIDSLDWHRRVKLFLSSRTVQDSSKSFDCDDFSGLLIEGFEFVQLFCRSQSTEEFFQFEAEQIMPLLSTSESIQKQMRTMSRKKLESNSPGKRIIEHLSSIAHDESHGSPMLSLAFLVWRLVASDLIKTTCRVPACSNVSRPSLVQARDLKARQPKLPNVHVATAGHDCRQNNYFLAVTKLEHSTVGALEKMVQTGDETERSGRIALQSLKDLYRGSYEKRNELSDTLKDLSSILALFKSPSSLALSQELEDMLNKQVRDLAWLAKTCTYRTLHTDDTSALEGNDEDANKGRAMGSSKVPWDVLVSLFERMPVLPDQGERNSGDLARVALRVRELHDAARAWQEEVSSLLSLSFRGVKKRVHSSPERQQTSTTGSDHGSQQKVDFRSLETLARDPILARVAMPREEAVLVVVEKAAEFEKQLWHLLERDYEGVGPDRARLPKGRSLVGKRGEFLLYRLTGSGLYVVLQESLSSLAATGSEVLAETPGKSTFDWIMQACSWIESLRKSVTGVSPFGRTVSGKLTVPSGDARRLLEEGRGLFLNVRDDVRKTLSMHKISLSRNRQTGKLSVIVSKSGAHHSVGGTFLRWCPLLLECVQADIEKLRDWETRVTMVSKEVKKLVSNSAVDGGVLYRVCRLREQLDSMAAEGRSSLVVSPEPTFVKLMMQDRDEIDSWLARACSNESESVGIDSFLSKVFEDGEAVVEDRYLLLNSLLGRHKQKKCSNLVSMSTSIARLDNASFRDKTRALFERSFLDGMEMMGIGEQPYATFCALKAQELERAVHCRLQGNSGQTVMTNAYREKIRDLHYSLEDIENPMLCARVLIGDITVEKLVDMSLDQLLTKDVPVSRISNVSKAAVGLKDPTESSKGRHLELVPPKRAKSSSPNPRVELVEAPNPVNTAQDRLSPLNQQNNQQKKKSFNKAQSPKAKPTPLFSSPSLSKLLQTVSSSPAPASDGLASPPRALPPPPLMTQVLSPSGASSPRAPSPPPSPHSNPHAALGPDSLLLNSDGGDRFIFTFKDVKLTFMAGLHMEDFRHVRLHGVIPEELTSKGRLKIPEFAKFISLKLRGGKWKAIVLRLQTYSGDDALEYKSFYKDFEAKQRIAMFAVGDSKLFLVTPRFHRNSRDLCELFSNADSTYAVFLTKGKY